MYAIVDIETTGSFPDDNGITEIAIVLHNGIEVEGRFETLINPGVAIPKFVAHLTGITDKMVSTAPAFSEVATNIYRILNNRIFIAHNVNFDFSFIKYHLRIAGYDWHPKKLCTLKLARKAFPGLPKYGLGSLCRSLDINIENRHRAGGDADATAILFEKIVAKGGEKLVKEFLKKENHEQILPPNLPNEQVKNLPQKPGVYYFLDAKEKVIYVGKAKNLKNRVVSHFSGLNTGKKRQEFLRIIHSVNFKECATEFAASIFESIEIKRLWPIFNISQKRPEQLYGIYYFEDAKGYKRLAIDKRRKHFEPLISFHLMADAHRILWKTVKQYGLHPTLCFLDKTAFDLIDYPELVSYNIKVEAAVIALTKSLGTFLISEPTINGNKHSCILVENGKFYGMGLILPSNIKNGIEHIKTKLIAYPENETIRCMISSFAEKNPSMIKDLEC